MGGKAGSPSRAWRRQTRKARALFSAGSSEICPYRRLAITRGPARLGPELRGGQREARRSSSFADLPLPVQRPDQASTAAKSLAWR